METQAEIKSITKQSDGEFNGNGLSNKTYRTSTLVIGGGQAGLSVGYYLTKHNVPFIILDANDRIGDTWRSRWDSLKLFTPARYNGLPGMRYPAPIHYFVTKDEMADFLESYAKKFNLPVRNGVLVDSLEKQNEYFVAKSGATRYEADNVVIAMSSYQKPKIPVFAKNLDPAITQFHSCEYKNLNQLQAGDLLLVGAGNSGSEIAMEASRKHNVYMSGRDTGNVPFRIASQAAKYLFLPFVLRFMFHRVFTIKTPIGRRMRPKVLNVGGPLIRVMPEDLKAAGIVRVAKTIDIKNGKPILEDGTVLNVKNVIWCTGYHTGFSWIKLPVFNTHEPNHRGGIVHGEPGLYFVGLHFLYSFSSTMIQGVGRDAKRITNHILARSKVAV